ncbi:MAG: tetratricopeptide repeat protein [Deltaproteobacteria bacterium]|nr:MAG: tetratricopeptide repeat protein [Deltaproteobacteria bacterium]
MRVRSFWLVALSGVVLLAGCRSNEQAIADHLGRGKQYQDEKKFAEAIIEYKNVLQIDPNRADAHYELAKSYLQLGQAKEGFWELRETVRLDPKNHEAAVQFGQISIYAGEVEEALKRADAVIAEDPKNEKAWLVKGQAHEALKQPAEALNAFQKAAEAAPTSEAALLVLANYHRRNGDRKTAGNQFEAAAKNVPTMQTLLALASFYSEDRSRDADAEAAYRKALELAKPEEVARPYALLGNFLFARDRFDDGVAVLEKGIEASPDPLDLIYTLARMYRQKGDVAKADELMERATQKQPDNPKPFLVLSSYKGRQGDLEGALAAADKALELAPKDQNAQLRKAEVLLELGYRDSKPDRIAEGRKLVDAVLAAEPSNPGGLFVKAKLDMADNKLDDAVQALRSAIDVRPDWAEAHFLLGTSLRLTGQRSAARTELARALEIDASLVEARRVLAEVHADLGEHEYAVEEGRRFLQQRPDATDMRVRVAQSLVLLGRLDEALAEVNKIPESARDENVQFALGRIYTAKGENEKARALLLQALAKRPNHPDILRGLLQIEEKMGKRDEALARISKAVAEKPDDAKLQQLAAVVALMQGKVDDATGALEHAIQVAPDDMTSYQQLADLYVRTGRTSQTIEIYEKALQRKPDQPRIHHFLGVLYEYGGKPEVAVTHYEEAIKLSPDLAESKNNLAYLYAESGKNLDRALDLAQDAKALMPDDPNTADTLGWVLFRRGVPSAAIGYLKEAEAGVKPEDATLGIIRHHLAQAYEASGDKENARNTLDRAIAAQEAFVEAQKARGVPVGSDPTWYQDARKMRERL